MRLRISLRNETGISLIELLFVLAIALAIIMFGLRFYSQYTLMMYEREVQANVEKLFQAMKYYYGANCGDRSQVTSYNADGSPNITTAYGKLDPNGGSLPSVFPINIQTDLINSGYLKNWFPLNPLIDSAAGTKGYFVQFNQATGNTSYVTCNNFSGLTCQAPTVLSSAGGALGTSQVTFWRAQVAVKLLPGVSAATAQQYMYDMSADCVSTISGGAVVSCKSSPSANGYLVWERLATYVSPNATSPLQVSMPKLREFRTQYTNANMALINGVTVNNSQNYLCGE